MSKFKPSRIYTLEDLKQDVLRGYAKWLTRHDSAESIEKVLRRIAYNQLVNVYRSKEERAPSFEDLGLNDDHVAQSRETVAASKSFFVRGSLSKAIDNAVASIEFSILVEELTSKLPTDKERELFKAYFVRGETSAAIGRARGITRQAASRQLGRMVRKLKKHVNRK